MGRPLRGVATLVFAALGGVRGQWVKDITDTLADGSDPVTVHQLIAESGGISAESCGGPEDAFEVSSVDVSERNLALVLQGTLRRSIKGGTVHGKVNLLKPKGLSIGSHFKYLAGAAFTRSRAFQEPLCKHLGLPEEEEGEEGGGCALQPGSQAMRFSLGNFPKVLFVGKYVMSIKVLDEAGRPVACAQGSLTVQPDKSKGVLRKLESGCPAMIMNHLHFIRSIDTDTCEDSADKVNPYRTTHFRLEGADFTLIGHWWQACKTDSPEYGLTVYKRHSDLYKACTMTSECDPAMCPGVEIECRQNGDTEFKQCSPVEGSCEEDEFYPEQDLGTLSDRCLSSSPVPVASGSSIRAPGPVLLASSLVALLAPRF